MSVTTSNLAVLNVNATASSSSSFNALGSSSGSTTSSDKDKESLWYFTADQLINSPSRRHGIDIDQELSYRQMTAYLIQEMGQRLQVSQLCINTAIVYMHRFYAFHSFTHFHRNGIAAASLFLAAKVEEQPRKLEHVIKAANKCLNQPTSSTTDTYYLEQAQDLVFNENVLLQTLGFDVAIDHPHTHVVKTCHLVKACKDLAQTSYFLASNSLHLTSMCLQYKPTVVACFCIYLACKWSRWEIPQSTEGKHWFHYVDKTVTMDLLKQLTDEFIAIYEKSPARLKSKLNSIKALAQGASNRVVNKDKKATPEEWKMVDMMKMYHSSINTSDTNNVNALTSNSFPASTPIDQQQQQQHQQNVQTSLLPPPSNHSHQQIRRPESHSSQHRSHHSSSTSHHHSKQAFATSDVADHKATSNHKPHYSSSASRPSRDHAQVTQNPIAVPPLLPPTSSTSVSRGNLLASNSNSSRSVMSGGVTTQKLSSQTHEASFHKSRDRGGLPAVLNSSSVFPTAHKLPQKPDTGRIVSTKEHIGRVPSEQNKSSNNKMFVPANVPQGGSNQLLSGTEISRNMIHQQHQRIHSSSGFHQPPLPRTSISSTNSSKHDPTMSVQMQSTQHKHPLSLDSQFTALSSEQMQPSQSLYAGTALPTYSNPSRTSDATHSGGGDPMETDPTSQTYSSFLPIHGGFKPQTQLQTKMSMFSPEWNEKMQQQQQNTSSSGSNSSNKPTSSLNYRMHSSSSNLESPKKLERERNSNTPTKKERNRISYAGIDIAHQQQAPAATTTRPNTTSQSTQKLQIQKKPDTSNSNLSVLAGTSANAYSSIKRPNENATIKHEDDLVRDSKMRKLDCVAPTNLIAGAQSFADTNKLQVVNGIETNPDLVRTLLKESLCTTNALIKTETPASIQTTITNSFQPPLQLLDPAVKIKEEKVALPTALSQSIEIDDIVAGSKNEKKKKKDKHKHKEKDKSKDREERKKHKKDKERHKDREPDNSEPVKIKISKEKFENTSSIAGGVSESLGFKIKIPKERIISDLGSGGAGGSSNYGSISAEISNSSAPPPALKIKISKDKLENYSSGSSTSIDPTSFSNLHNQSGLVSNNLYGSSSSGALGSSSNSKKKDRERDREREKEKKRNSLEYAKLNSNGSGGAAVVGNASIIQTSTSSAKNSSSSKIQLYNNNMSQLFGESNDDDDDDDKTTYHKPKKSSLLKTVNSTLSSSAQNYHIPIKQSLDMSFNSDGNYNLQQQQHQQQFLAHQLANQQRQIYQKK